MSAPNPVPGRARFGDFELDLGAGELRRNGARLSIPEQPFRLLEVLVEHPGMVVSRDHLRERLWSAGTFVDFEHGLNAAVKRLRDALGDSAEQPRYIETVPKRGYRFSAPVELLADSPPPSKPPPPQLARGPWIAAIGLGAVLIVSVAGWCGTRPRPPEPGPEAPRRLTRLTFEPGLQTDPTFSPDGQFIAYASNRSGNFDIWMQPVASGSAVQLTKDSADDTQPDWSPDGKSIAFRSERDGGGIFVVSPTDRHVRQIARTGYHPRWSPDGSKLAFADSIDTSAYLVAAADGGGVTRVTLPTWQDRGFSIVAGWHPSGRLVFLHGYAARLGLAVSTPDTSAAVPHPLPTTVRERFVALSLNVEDGQPLSWTADGRFLYFVGEAAGVKGIWRLTVDPGSLNILGGPDPVTTAAGWNLTPATSRTGVRMAFSAATPSLRVWLFALHQGRRVSAADGKAVTPQEVDAMQPALSPNGRNLAIIGRRLGAPPFELMVISIDDPERVTTIRSTPQDNMFAPRWSPDGTAVAYSYREAPSGTPPTFSSCIRVIDVQSLRESSVTSMWESRRVPVENSWGWAADAKSLLASGDRYDGKLALVRLPMSGAPTAERMARTLVSSATDGFFQASESPDGRWIIYGTAPLRGMNASTLYLTRSDGGEPRRLIDGDSWDDKPRWSADGRVIYFLSKRSGRFNVWGIEFDSRRGQTVGSPFRITDFNTPHVQIAGFDRIGDSEIGVAEHRLALPLQTLSGGIWMLE